MTIYVAVNNEGTPCWRPVDAVQIEGGIFRIVGCVPEDEEWAFQPGDVVRCVLREFGDGNGMVAVEVVDEDRARKSP